MFEDALVRKRIWNGSCVLDQDLLGLMVAAAKVPGSDSMWMNAPVYKVWREVPESCHFSDGYDTAPFLAHEQLAICLGGDGLLLGVGQGS